MIALKALVADKIHPYVVCAYQYEKTNLHIIQMEKPVQQKSGASVIMVIYA